MTSEALRTATGGTSAGDDRVVAGTGLSAGTRVVGVMGFPVGHSLSPLLHNTAFAHLGVDWVSVGFPVPPGRAGAALAGARDLGIRGLSVTMPHKEDVADAVDVLTPAAERLGAVNCVFDDDGVWFGDNTDGAGMIAALRRGGRFEPLGRRCMVVGAGGAARAVIAALGDAGAAEVVVVNRTAERAEAAAGLAGPVGRVGGAGEAPTCELVVNATPAGMAGVVDGPTGWPVDPSLLGPAQVVVDLVYHPPVTDWLAAAARRGATTANGLGMLVHQAALQIERWTGLDAPVDAMWDAVAGATGGAAFGATSGAAGG
ncbi:MAG: shikimate dehydrogenase [Acidimicrobiales bacterium]|jgi:shikimate dehydrogenase